MVESRERREMNGNVALNKQILQFGLTQQSDLKKLFTHSFYMHKLLNFA